MAFIVCCTPQQHSSILFLSNNKMAKTSTPAVVPSSVSGSDRYEVLAASAPHKRKQGPKHHSRSYPRGVGLDFRKLAGLTLASYIDHHGT